MFFWYFFFVFYYNFQLFKCCYTYFENLFFFEKNFYSFICGVYIIYIILSLVKLIIDINYYRCL